MSQLPSQLPTMGALYSDTMQQLQGFGQAQQQQLQQNYQSALGMAQQQMAQSGLAGTSVAPSMAMGYMKQYQNSLANLSQQLTQTRLGIQDTLGVQGTGLQQQEQQIQNQMTLGMGNLGVAQGQLALGQLTQAQQNAIQKGQLALGQTTQQQWYGTTEQGLALQQQQQNQAYQLGMAQLTQQNPYGNGGSVTDSGSLNPGAMGYQSAPYGGTMFDNSGGMFS